MAFYATCPHCKIPMFVEEGVKQAACAVCNRAFAPGEQFDVSVPVADDSSRRRPPPIPWSDDEDWNAPDLDIRVTSASVHDPAKPSHTRSVTTEGLVSSVMLLEICNAVFTGFMLYGAGRAQVEREVASKITCVITTCGVTRVIVFLLAIGYFFAWLAQAHANLRYLGVSDLRYDGGSVALSFFIPILNLIEPYRVVQNLWKASDLKSTGNSWRNSAGSRRVLTWWLLWIVAQAGIGASVTFVVKTFWSSAPITLGEFQFRATLAIASSLAMVSAGFFLIAVIHGLRARQTAKFEQQSQRPQ